MSRPPWIRSSTEPSRDEVERVAAPPVDPEVLAAARAATTPSPGEVARLVVRLPAPRRSVGVRWLAGPALLAVALLTARWTLSASVLDGVAPGDDGSWIVQADTPTEVWPGVFVQGRGEAVVADGRLALTGILRVDARAPVSFAVGGATFATDGAQFQVDGDALAVVRGTVRAPGGRFLVAGDRWSPAVVAAAPAPLPTELPPVVAPRRVAVRAPAPPEVAAPSEAPAPSVAPAPSEAPAPSVAPGTAPAPAPAASLPADIVAWRVVLDEREAGLGGGALVHRLEAYAAAFPDSPFTGEALDQAALAQVGVAAPAEALAALEERLGRAGPHTLALHAAAAFVARESLRDCGRAAPHDAWVAERGDAGQRATAEAFLGLCALRDDRGADAAAHLARVDATRLDPALAEAVARARAIVGGAP